MSVQPSERYLQVQVQTASPEALITMLYDAAVRFLHQGRAYRTAGDAPAAWDRIERAEDILMELMDCLDFERGEVARNLYNLYEYGLYRLAEAKGAKDVEGLDEVARMLAGLRESWVDAVRSSSGCPAQP